jgi:hypothetical protein
MYCFLAESPSYSQDTPYHREIKIKWNLDLVCLQHYQIPGKKWANLYLIAVRTLVISALLPSLFVQCIPVVFPEIVIVLWISCLHNRGYSLHFPSFSLLFSLILKRIWLSGCHVGVIVQHKLDIR